jgi:hypothetical protein
MTYQLIEIAKTGLSPSVARLSRRLSEQSVVAKALMYNSELQATRIHTLG